MSIPKVEAYIIYLRGARETLELLPVPSGFRIACVPLGSESIAYGDFASVRETKEGLRVVGVRHGGWRTIHSKTPLPPSADLTRQIAARGWLGAWNKQQHLGICVPTDELADARALVARWEEEHILFRLERSLSA